MAAALKQLGLSSNVLLAKGGAPALLEAMDARVLRDGRLSTAKLKFVLDGDKLFALRAQSKDQIQRFLSKKGYNKINRFFALWAQKLRYNEKLSKQKKAL